MPETITIDAWVDDEFDTLRTLSRVIDAIAAGKTVTITITQED